MGSLATCQSISLFYRLCVKLLCQEAADKLCTVKYLSTEWSLCLERTVWYDDWELRLASPSLTVNICEWYKDDRVHPVSSAKDRSEWPTPVTSILKEEWSEMLLRNFTREKKKFPFHRHIISNINHKWTRICGQRCAPFLPFLSSFNFFRRLLK